MERKLIIVVNVFDDISKSSQSIESIRNAAHRWGANFYEITNVQFPNSPHPFMWDRLIAFEEFNHYDKILALDPDIVINSNAPSIFDELTNDFDFCAVLDGNPGGRFPNNDGFLRDSIVKTISHDENSLKIFGEIFKGFNYEKYWSHYCNLGVQLFNPKKYNPLIKEMRELVYNNKKAYELMLGFHSLQNFANALISSSDVRIKILDNTWNWIMPDIAEEYNHDFYLGKMKPWIYHFTGTSGSKKDLLTYDRWK